MVMTTKKPFGATWELDNGGENQLMLLIFLYTNEIFIESSGKSQK